MNWGKGITIGIVLFMLFIISFVFRAYQDKTDLVSEDYYEQEAKFENKRDGKHNYNELQSEIKVEKEENGICFYFPENISASTNGNIVFYRPSEKKMDRTFELEIDTDHRQCLSYEYFFEGYYDITVEWSNNNEPYIFEDNIQF